jgi:hypothetical protein
VAGKVAVSLKRVSPVVSQQRGPVDEDFDCNDPVLNQSAAHPQAATAPQAASPRAVGRDENTHATDTDLAKKLWHMVELDPSTPLDQSADGVNRSRALTVRYLPSGRRYCTGGCVSWTPRGDFHGPPGAMHTSSTYSLRHSILLAHLYSS